MHKQLFLDCDGVLADFDGHFQSIFNMSSDEYEQIHGSKHFWGDIRTCSLPFFRHLPLMPDAKRLYEAVKQFRPIILTGCPRGDWAQPQKLAWAAEHFPGVPMITCMSRDKRDYCQPGDLLVDDLYKYKHLWEDAGGKFIHYHNNLDEVLYQILFEMIPYPQ